jgi:hypothetical protein
LSLWPENQLAKQHWLKVIMDTSWQHMVHASNIQHEQVYMMGAFDRMANC